MKAGRPEPERVVVVCLPCLLPCVMIPVLTRYVVSDPAILSGEPIIQGTRTPVRAIVELWRLGVSPEAIPQRLPHLTQAQVFDALSYFSDHLDEIAAHIAANRVDEDEVDPILRSR